MVPRTSRYPAISCSLRFLGVVLSSTSIRRHLDYTSARLRRLGFGVVAFFRPIYRLKDRKNGGFRADPLAKYHRFSFFGTLFKDFRKILYAKIRHVPPSYWRCRIHISRFSSYIIIGIDVSFFIIIYTRSLFFLP